MSIQAALTGHLVFSSLHANGSVGAITRLRDLGVDDFLIASTLRAVIAQRLLRRLCPACRRPHAPSVAEREHFARHGVDAPDQVFSAGGCDGCNGSGYAGRVGIFEMFEMDAPMRDAVDRGASEAEMRTLALDPRETLIGQGLLQVRAGTTSLSETLRVVGDTA